MARDEMREPVAPRSKRTQKATAHGNAQQAIVGDDSVQVNVYGASREADAPVRLWNMDARNPHFSGRGKSLSKVQMSLKSGNATVVHALSGMPGVGKTQIALEFVHRFADDYDIAWWIDSDQHELIPGQLYELAKGLGLVTAGASHDFVISVLRSWLRDRSRWILVFDNAGSPGELRPWLPNGRGHVLITSRIRRWRGLAEQVEIDVLDRDESVELVRTHHPVLDHEAATRLADRMGDLPLALVQAASFMEESGTTPDDYLRLLDDHAQDLLEVGSPTAYGSTLTAMVSVTCSTLGRNDPRALEMLRVCAFLAPEPIPHNLVLGVSSKPDGRTGTLSPVSARTSLARLVEYNLLRSGRDGLRMHRLMHALIRGQLDEAGQTRVEAEALRALARVHPGRPTDPSTWDSWALLVPHLLGAGAVGPPSVDLRTMMCDAAFYLITTGKVALAERWTRELEERWRNELGGEEETVLRVSHVLALSYRHLGRINEARDLDQRVYEARRLRFGADHVSTLDSANNLGKDFHALGDYTGARDLHQETLRRRRAVNGPKHIDTLNAAHNLASALHSLGDHDAAREINEMILECRRDTLGPTHFHTFYSMDNLARDLLELGRVKEAVALFGEAYRGRIQATGIDHPETLKSGSGLARALYRARRVKEAVELNDDVTARSERALGSDHPDTVRSRDNLE